MCLWRKETKRKKLLDCSKTKNKFSSNRLKQKRNISPWHGAEWCFKQIELQWNKELFQISSLQPEDKRDWEPYRTWFIKRNQRYYGGTKKGQGNHRHHEISRRKKLLGVESLNVPLTCLKTVADGEGPIDHNPLAHQHQITRTLKDLIIGSIDPHRSVHWWFNHTKLSWSSTLQLQLKQIHTTNQQKTQYALKSFWKLKPWFFEHHSSWNLMAKHESHNSLSLFYIFIFIF
jgi:hypothetical protein